MNILIMMDLLIFERENSAHIKAVENSFGAFGQPLSKPDRMFLGQGRLMKKGRTRWQLKSFFLFNDVLVYGSILSVGNWHKKQKIIALGKKLIGVFIIIHLLFIYSKEHIKKQHDQNMIFMFSEDIQVEDTEDSFDVKNQWLIRTPGKSFYMAAPSIEEKEAWIEHIKDCQTNLLLDGSRQLGSTFAVTWIPDSSAMKCMRCFKKFTLSKRRHHCRKCGFLVCNPCSKDRVLLDNINTQKCVRVCSKCYAESKEFENSHQTGDDNRHNSWEKEYITTCNDTEQ